MSCERFREAIASHAAGADLEGQAAAHLLICESCAERLDLQRLLLADVDAELDRALSITASPELVTRVIARADTPSRPGVWRPTAAWAGLAAAAALAVGMYLRAPVSTPSVGSRGLASAPPPA